MPKRLRKVLVLLVLLLLLMMLLLKFFCCVVHATVLSHGGSHGSPIVIPESRH